MKMSRKTNGKRSGAANLAAPFIVTAFSLGGLLGGIVVAHGQGPRPEQPMLPPPFVHGPPKTTPERSQAQQARQTVSSPNPGQLLHHMLKANQAYSFIAREITLNSNGQETEQWVRWDPKLGLRRESIRPVSGNILIDNFRSSYVYAQNNHQWTEQNSLLPRPSGRIKDVIDTIASGQLKAHWVGQDTVAGRTADIVLISPNSSEPAPTRRVWIDRLTGVRLKLEYIGPAGRMLSSSYYLSIDIAPQIDPHDFEPPQLPVNPVVKDDHRRFSSAEEAARSGFVVPQPTFLPAGFTLRQIDVNKTKGSTSLRWANGITVISLVQVGKPYGKKLLDQLGPGQAGFIVGKEGRRSYIWRNQESGACYAILSSLPDDEIRRIADSVK